MGRSLSVCTGCLNEWPDSCIDASGLCDTCREQRGLPWRCPNQMEDSLAECPVCDEVHPSTRTRIFHVRWSPENDEWVATCDQFPSLSWLEESPSAALDGLLTLLIAAEVATPDLFRPRHRDSSD